MNIRLVTGSWEELGPDAGSVRKEVFVQEQGIPAELEWDSWDPRSLHCVAYEATGPIATGRLLPDGHIGRMAVLAGYRRSGVGGQILSELIDAAQARGELRLELSAQQQVVGFYLRHGFKSEGPVYDEVGIPHQKMTRQLRDAMPVQTGESEQEMPDGSVLLQREWRPADPARGGVYLLHGLGEHSGRHAPLAHWLAARGWWVRSHDHLGHGRSSGVRGVIAYEGQLIEHARFQVRAFAANLPSPPVLFGQSMGGTLAAELALQHDARLRGLVLSAPGLAFRLSPWQRGLSVLMRRLAPSLAVASRLDPAQLSHDPEVVAAYRRDPLVHARICARLANWMFSSARRNLKLAPQLRVPTLVLLPEADRIVDPQGALQFAERAPRSLVMLCRYPGLLHEPFNERLQDRAWVYADLSAWLEQLEA